MSTCNFTEAFGQGVVFEIDITPASGTVTAISFLKFFEKAPVNYDWINGASGINDYPTRFGVRILKNGNLIFAGFEMPTSVDQWQERLFDFTNDIDFLITGPARLRFELVSYCPIGNGAQVSAWDLDEISLMAECDLSRSSINVSGFIRDAAQRGVGGVVMTATNLTNPGNNSIVLTDHDGYYQFHGLQSPASYTISPSLNTEPSERVNVFDLVMIQKHLLGLDLFDSTWQMIAADANGSKSLSVLDLLAIRKLLTGNATEYPKNSSWRFGVAGQTLPPDDPWSFQEHLQIQTQGVDIGNAHFRAVKIGDVTGETTD